MLIGIRGATYANIRGRHRAYLNRLTRFAAGDSGFDSRYVALAVRGFTAIGAS